MRANVVVAHLPPYLPPLWLFSGCKHISFIPNLHFYYSLLLHQFQTQQRRSSSITTMPAQALLSSSSLVLSAEAARQTLGPRSHQSPLAFSRKASFIVKAASTPPVKVSSSLTPFFFFSLFICISTYKSFFLFVFSKEQTDLYGLHQSKVFLTWMAGNKNPTFQPTIDKVLQFRIVK